VPWADSNGCERIFLKSIIVPIYVHYLSTRARPVIVYTLLTPSIYNHNQLLTTQFLKMLDFKMCISTKVYL